MSLFGAKCDQVLRPIALITVPISEYSKPFLLIISSLCLDLFCLYYLCMAS